MVSEAIQGTYRNTYSEDRIQQLIYIGTGGLVKASQTEYSFLLSTGATTNNYLPTSTTAPYVTAQYYPTVQVSDVIMFPPKSGTTGKDVQGWVSSISGTGNALTITVKLLDATNDLTAADFPCRNSIDTDIKRVFGRKHTAWWICTKATWRYIMVADHQKVVPLHWYSANHAVMVWGNT